MENGQLAVVMVNGDEATVKYFRQEGSLVVLTPKSFNPVHQPQIYDLKRVQVRVVGPCGGVPQGVLKKEDGPCGAE